MRSGQGYATRARGEASAQERDVAIGLQGNRLPEMAGDIVHTMALALHELATNARTYGALAGSKGRLDVSWDVCTDARERRRLVVLWHETGADQRPHVQSTVSQPGGYDRELNERALS